MENIAVPKSVQMKPQLFEAYNLEDLCNSFHSGKGPQIYDYLIDDILSQELDNCAAGMEYSLIYLKDIGHAIISKADKTDFENDIQDYIIEFLARTNKDALVFIQGW